jgi:hypothetical protein
MTSAAWGATATPLSAATLLFQAGSGIHQDANQSTIELCRLSHQGHLYWIFFATVWSNYALLD